MKYIIGALVLLPSLAHAESQKTSPPNGFDLYLQASKLIETAQPNVDSIDDARPPATQKERAQRYSLKRRRAWLKQNAAGFALFQKALQTPVKHPTFKPEFLPDGEYASLRQLARDKAIERNTREMRGDWNGAMQSRLDIVQMGADTGRGGVLISGLVAVAIQAIGRDTPWQASEKLSLRQTRAAIARLQNIYDRRLRAADVLQDEKQYGLAMLRTNVRGLKWRDITKWNEEATPAERSKLVVLSPKTMERNYTRMIDVYIANARLPLLAKKAPLPKITDSYTKIIAPVFERSHLNFARNDAGNAVWLCALALHAHKLETGKYPTKLDELAPRYLKRIPADPFGGGEPLRYKRSSNAYVLWSIGPDGKDDGGTPIRHRADYKRAPGKPERLPSVDFEAKGDYVAGKNR